MTKLNLLTDLLFTLLASVGLTYVSVQVLQADVPLSIAGATILCTVAIYVSFALAASRFIRSLRR
jgi:hypothetical protein